MHSGNKKSTYITIEAKCKLWKRYNLSKADRDYSLLKMLIIDLEVLSEI